jgi:hypothetical protein
MKLVFLFLVLLLYSPFCSPINFLSPHFISTLVKLKLDSYIDRIIQNPRCASDFKLWISSLLRGELWAISSKYCKYCPSSFLYICGCSVGRQRQTKLRLFDGQSLLLRKLRTMFGDQRASRSKSDQRTVLQSTCRTT